MRRILRLGAGLVAVAVLSVAAIVVGYDLVYFQPALSEVRRNAHLSNKSALTPLLERYLEVTYGSSLQFHAGKILLRESDLKAQDGSTAFFWGKLVELHMARSEQLLVIASQAYLGSGHYGFASASQAMFGKPIEQLSSSESATLVALVHAPSYYESNPGRLAHRRDFVLDKVKNHAF